MARPVTIKDETILEAAREIFLSRGISATTAEVAERAGVSEGSVFKRFKSKAVLFRAAMADHLVEPEWIRKLPARVGVGQMRDQLVEIADEMLAFFADILPLMMMSLSNPAGNGLPAAISGPNPPPVRALRQLTRYMEAEMRLGRLRHHDPEIVARAFLGSLQNYVFFEMLHRATKELPLPRETYAREIVNLLWTGIEPVTMGPQAAPNPGSPKASPFTMGPQAAPNPGSPKASPFTMGPRAAPNPGSPKASPFTMGPQAAPNPGSPKASQSTTAPRATTKPGPPRGSARKPPRVRDR